MITATLGASLLRNMLADRGMKSKIAEHNAIITGLGVIWVGIGTIRAVGGTTRAGQNS